MSTPPVPLTLKAVIASLVAATLLSCANRIILQEHQLAPQRNYGRPDRPTDDFLNLPMGTSQADVLQKFGKPILVHADRHPCAPWDSCTYADTRFVYRSSDNDLCTVHLARGVLDRKPDCVTYVVPPVLGPGDFDPRSGYSPH